MNRTRLAWTTLMVATLAAPAALAQDARSEPDYRQEISAAKTMRRCKEVDPSWAESIRKRWPGMSEALDWLVEDPLDPARHNNLGNEYVRRQLFDLAYAAYECSTKVDKKFAPGWSNLGLIYLARDKEPEAIAALERAVEIKPHDAMAYYHLALAYDRADEYDQAIAAYERAINLDPRVATVRYNPGVIRNPHRVSLFLRRLMTDQAVRFHLEPSPPPKPDEPAAPTSSESAEPKPEGN